MRRRMMLLLHSVLVSDNIIFQSALFGFRMWKVRTLNSTHFWKVINAELVPYSATVFFNMIVNKSEKSCIIITLTP